MLLISRGNGKTQANCCLACVLRPQIRLKYQESEEKNPDLGGTKDFKHLEFQLKKLGGIRQVKQQSPLDFDVQQSYITVSVNKIYEILPQQ